MELKIKVSEKLAEEISNDIEGSEAVQVKNISVKSSTGGSSFEPFTTMLLVVTSYAVISRIMDFLMDQKYPGSVVHVDKTGDVSVEQSPGIPNGSVLFVSPDGEKEMFKREDIGKGLLQTAIEKFSPSTA